MESCIIIPDIARRILIQMREKFPEELEGRNGGHIVIQKVGKDTPTHSHRVRVGRDPVSEDVFKRYETNALEKASRLAGLADTDGHISSWQSRDFDNKKYGGAIAATGVVISFSGLPEHFDEYLTIQVALRFHRIHRNTVKEILEISGNKHR